MRIPVNRYPQLQGLCWIETITIDSKFQNMSLHNNYRHALSDIILRSIRDNSFRKITYHLQYTRMASNWILDYRYIIRIFH